MIRHLKFFTLRLFKEGILLLFFVLDLIGLLLLYFTSWIIPTWVLVLLPVVGIYVASFKLYIRGTAEIRIDLAEPQSIKFERTGGHAELTQRFSTIISGHISNWGHQTGVLEEVSLEVDGVNGVRDSFLLGRLNTGFKISPLLRNRSLIWYEGMKTDEIIKPPFVLTTGTVQPFWFHIDMYIDSYRQQEIEEIISWIKTIDIKLSFTVMQSDGRRNEGRLFIVPTPNLKQVSIEAKERRKILLGEDNKT